MPQPERGLEGASLRVLAKGADGAPIEGALFWLIDPTEVQPDRAVIASRTLGDWVAASRELAAEVATSGLDGTVTFKHPVQGGWLVAGSRGPLFGMVERSAPPREGETVAVTMEERVAYPILTLGPEGQPQAGVQVTLAAPDPGTPGRPYLLPSTAVTNGQGEATLYEPPAEAAGNVLEGLAQIPERLAVTRVASAGVAPRPLVRGERVTVALPETEPLEIRLEHRAFPPGHWSGLVQVFPASDGSRSDRTLAAAATGGVARLSHVASGEDLSAVTVIAESRAPWRFIGKVTIDPASGVVSLDQGLVLDGRCVDGDGTPLPGQAVELFPLGDPASAWTVMTDDEGRFRWWLAGGEQPRARTTIGARIERPGGDLRATHRLGDVSPGQVVDLGALSFR